MRTLVTAARTRWLALVLPAFGAIAQAPAPQPAAKATSVQAAAYFPPKGSWEHRAPAEVGMDADKLAAAVAFATAHPTDWPQDFHTQEQMFGRLLGPLPKTRADTNGLVIRRGYVVAEFGDVAAVDPT